ncbi:MAG: UDP-N-acetylmuramoyl-tripeptide--D-alanyl-D-alanine ligase [Spirochaetaceae bacterium]|nr:MAG: UDP-N-acetylmuramoyl-tripeptide--D-alanyl-D-alanine ligase [Spirochaetaceae bacterium]
MDSATALFSAQQAAAVLDAQLHGDPQARFNAITVDSRSVTPGSLFVALGGERTDGHRYVGDALAAGASAILVASAGVSLMPRRRRVLKPYPAAAILTVEDTLAALQRLAAVYRARMSNLTVIGITGSNGKTTTKELIGAVMSLYAPTFVSHGNLNSDIGLPLSVFGINDRHRYAVLEMGMNRIGEMRQLAAIARPDVALITNIGTAHIGNIGSIEQIISEKKAICAEFGGSQRLLIWEDEPHSVALAEGVNGTVARYGPRSTPGWQGHQSRGLAGSTLQWRGTTIELALPGEYSVRNALAAIHVGQLFGVPDRLIAEAIGSVRPLFGRGEIIRGSMTAIVDCYNANPESVKQALDFTMSLQTPGKRIAVLGAMKELGAYTAAAHQSVIAYALECGLDWVLLLGQEFAPGALATDDARLQYCRTFEELVETLLSQADPDDVVLIKGSRSLELERLVPHITGQ